MRSRWGQLIDPFISPARTFNAISATWLKTLTAASTDADAEILILFHASCDGARAAR